MSGRTRNCGPQARDPESAGDGAVSAEPCRCHSCVGAWWVESRDAVHHPAVPRMVPAAESDPPSGVPGREQGYPSQGAGASFLLAGLPVSSVCAGLHPSRVLSRIPSVTSLCCRGDRLPGCGQCGSSGVWPSESTVHGVSALAAGSLQNTRSRQFLKRPCL